MNSVEVQIAPREAESIQVKVDRLVTQRIQQILSNDKLSRFSPFFEPKRLTDELRRLQSASDWHKWTEYYKAYGCYKCGDRERGHRSLGHCARCFSREWQRLEVITKRLTATDSRAQEYLDSQQLAYREYRQSTPLVRERKPLPNGMRRPHLKPQMHPEQAGARVRKLRKVAGLSLRSLAAMAGVSPLTVLKLEQGKRQPLPQNCDAIKKALGEAFIRAYLP